MIFVYVVFFNANEKLFQETNNSFTWQNKIYDKSNNITTLKKYKSSQNNAKSSTKNISQNIKQTHDNNKKKEEQKHNTWYDANKKDSSKMNIEGKTFFSIQSLFNKDSLLVSNMWTDNILLLRKDLRQRKPHIPVAQARLKSLESVGIQDFWKYILKDIDNTHYVYLWKANKNALRQRIEQTILPKWWNILAITDENRIKQDLWIGDEIRKITTPYSDAKKKVLAIIFWNQDGDTRFLQIDEEVIDRKTKELQEMFGKRY